MRTNEWTTIIHSANRNLLFRNERTNGFVAKQVCHATPHTRALAQVQALNETCVNNCRIVVTNRASQNVLQLICVKWNLDKGNRSGSSGSVSYQMSQNYVINRAKSVCAFMPIMLSLCDSGVRRVWFTFTGDIIGSIDGANVHQAPNKHIWHWITQPQCNGISCRRNCVDN